MADAARKTGIGIIGDVPWGTHFCHFYRAKEDLLNILVPYFQAGLENNEFCLWATAEPLGAKEARKAMEKAMPGFDRYLKTGQIEIVPHDRWYLKNGVFDSERVIRAWVDKLDRALAAGYSGMRASGNMSWLERKDWDSFADYEAALNRVIGQRQMVVLCAYWMKNISVADTFEVAGSHTFAVVGRNGDLELVEGAFHRKEAEEELRTSEERYRLLVENATEGIAVIQDGEIVFANSLVTEVIGHSEAGHPSRSIAELIHPDDRQMVMERLPGMPVSQERPGIFSFRIIDKEGNERWVEANMARYTWDGRPAALALVEDITERKKAEETIRRLASFPQFTPVLIMEFNLKMEALFVNPAMRLTIERLGIKDVREFIPLNWRQTLSGSDNIEWDEWKTQEVEVAGRVFEERLGFVRDFQSLRVYAADITQRRQAEEALLESEKRYRLLFDVTPVVISITTLEGRALSVNNAILEMSGYTPEEFVALNMNDIYVDPLERRRMRALLQREGGVRDFETGFRRKDGSISIVLLNADTIELDNQRLILATVRDITDRKRMEKDLLQSQALLNETERTGMIGGWAFDAETLTQTWTAETFRILEIDLTKGEPKVPEGIGFIAPEFRPMAEQAIQRAVEYGEPYDQEWEIITAKGNRKWVHSVARVHQEQGKTKSVAGSFQDITERKKAEEALEQHHRLLATTNALAIELASLPSGEISQAFVTKRLAEMTGAAAVWFSEYDPSDRTLVLRHTEMETELLEKVARLLGKQPNEVRSPVSEDMYSEIVSNVIGKRQTLTDVSFGTIPPSVGTAIQELMGVDHFIGIAYVIEGKLYGTSVLAMKAGRPDPARELLESVAHMVAISLRQRHAEDTLRQSEKKYRFMAENVSDVIWIIDMNLRPTYLSPSITKMTGYSVEETMARGMEKGLTPAAIEAVSEIVMAEVARKGEPNSATRLTTVEVEMEHKDGSKIWAESAGTLLRGPDGQPVEIIGILRDITKRRQILAALERSEDRFRALVESGVDGILLVDSTGVISYGSPSMTAMLGYEEGSNDGRSMADFVHPDDLPEVVRLFGQLVANPGGMDHMELRVKHKSGSWKWADVVGSNLLHDHAVEAIVINLRDIHDRKKAQNALAESEKKHRQLVETIHDGIWAIDKDSNTTFVNPRMAKMLGYTIEEMTGKHLFAFMDESGVKIAKYNLERRQQGIEEQHDFEFLRKDGTRVYTSLGTSAIIDDKGDYAGAIAGVQDITARKRAEEMLKRSHQLLSDTGEMAKVGGWELDLSTNEVSWTEEVGRIHGVGPGYRPKLEESLDFYAPESRSAVEAVVKKAAETGEPYDLESLLIPRGSKDKIWVRSLGRAVYSGGEIVKLAGTFQNIDKYKRVEEALKANEDKFRGLFEHMTSGVAVYEAVDNGEDFVVKDFNPAANKISKVSKEDVVGRRLTEAFPGIKESGLLDVFQRVWRTGKPEYCPEVIYRDEHNPGGWRENWIYKLPVGELVAVYNDITDRRRAEESLRKSETRYRLLADNLSDIIWTMGTDLKYTYISPSVTLLRGYTVEEAMAQPLAENLTSASMETAMKIMVEEEAMERTRQCDPTRSITMEVEVSCKNGSTIWMENKVTYLRDSNGQVAAYLGVSRDISERKRAEDRLRRQERYFRAITERSSDVVVVLGKEGNARYVSSSVELMLGITHERAVGAGFMNSVHPDDIPKVAEDWAYLIEHPGSTTKGERRLQHADGSWRYVEAIGYSLLNDPAVEGVVINIRDITELKKAEIKQRRINGQLILASRLASLGRLASGVAHEINNPLAVVMGCAQMLMEKDAPEEVKKDLSLINNSAEQMASIVQRLLTFGRQSKPGKRYMDINALVSRILELRAGEMSARNIEVTTRLDPDLPCTMADAGQMQQVFLNIILNAEQAMTKANNGGHLLVETGHTRDRIKITFKDDGIGIPKEYLPRLFDPFFTTKDVGEGMGLGLSISYGIIQEHDGRIYAKKQSGKGATFVVELPIVAKPDQPESPEKPAEEPREKVIGRILVVDDEPAICQLLKDLLTRDGHSVETVGDASVALEMLKRERFSLILLDIRMKGMNGIELYQQMGKIAESLRRRVIFITGDTLARETRDFLDGAAAPHICKPFDVRQLRKMINQVLWSEG